MVLIINQPRVCTNYHIGVDRSVVPGHGSDAHPLAKQEMTVVGIRPKILEGLLNISTDLVRPITNGDRVRARNLEQMSGLLPSFASPPHQTFLYFFSSHS